MSNRSRRACIAPMKPVQGLVTAWRRWRDERPRAFRIESVDGLEGELLRDLGVSHLDSLRHGTPRER